jgi:succinate dehydrogenase / fumarate reductase flavoprotein subunit
MFNYIPEFFKRETADTTKERRWYDGQEEQRRTPELLPRDEVAARSTPRSRPAAAHRTAASPRHRPRRPPDYIRKRLPSMYHQFKELANVDITKEPMEVGPTCHYVMGGVRVDADSTAATRARLFAAGEVRRPARLQPLGGNSLSDLLVFGRRAGLYAARLREELGGARSDAAQVETRRALEFLDPSIARAARTPYAIQSDLQETCRTWSASSARETS